MMTQIEAWQAMAKLWDKPVPSAIWPGNMIVCAGWGEYRGMCGVICYWVVTRRISTFTAIVMNRRIKRSLPKKCAYLFPFTTDGAKKRAAFCRRQARMIKRKEIKL